MMNETPYQNVKLNKGEWLYLSKVIVHAGSADDPITVYDWWIYNSMIWG